MIKILKKIFKLNSLFRIKNDLSKLIIASFSVILIVLFCLFLINNILYMHIHILPNGNTIVHSHPYNKSENSSSIPTHKHTNAELFFFFVYSLFFMLLLAIPIFIIKNNFVLYYYAFNYTYHKISLINNRGPPTSLIS